MLVKNDEKEHFENLKRKIDAIKRKIFDVDSNYAKIQGGKIAAYIRVVKQLDENNISEDQKNFLIHEKERLLEEKNIEYNSYKSQRDALNIELKLLMVKKNFNQKF